MLLALFVVLLPCFNAYGSRPSSDLTLDDFSNTDQQQALDRLVQEYRNKNAKEQTRQQKLKEYREWQQTPVVEWNTYFAFIGVTFCVIFIGIFYSASFKMSNLVPSIGTALMANGVVLAFTLMFQTKPNF